jgi:hypothetical protein
MPDTRRGSGRVHTVQEDGDGSAGKLQEQIRQKP